MNEYDQRQINLARRFIETYRKGELGLNALRQNLEALTGASTEKSPLKATIEITNTLDEIYAFASHENRQLDDEDRRQIEELLRNLESTILDENEPAITDND